MFCFFRSHISCKEMSWCGIFYQLEILLYVISAPHTRSLVLYVLTRLQVCTGETQSFEIVEFLYVSRDIYGIGPQTMDILVERDLMEKK